MLARWQATDSGRVDIADEMFRLSLDVVMDVLFGYDIGDEAPEIVGATLGVLHYLIKRSRSVPGIPSWMYPRSHVTFKRSLAVLDGVIARVLAERRRERASRSDAGSESETLLDLLIEAEGEARITAIGVRNEMMTMIIAGHETVASALTWAWRLVGDDAHVAQRLRDEGRALLASADSGEGGVESISHLGFARNVLSEAMRLYPPAWIVSRKSEPESNVRPDRWLPRGTLVMLSPYVTQRLQSYWPDPDRFDPTRFEGAVAPGTWFPYGAGQRLCIGKDFALVEATIVLSDVSRRYRLKPLSSSSRDYAGVTLQPEGGLDVELSAA
jgi:cytochrome P450